MDWTVRVLHGFWDSWLHERDVLLARGDEHPTDGDPTVYAAAYGLFIAAAAVSARPGSAAAASRASPPAWTARDQTAIP